MATLLSVLLGVSLSAAAGFRVFVPFLAISIAYKAGFVQLADGFAWIGTTPALIAFAVATIIEILAYYIPYIDNLLDMIAVPVAVVAGTVLTATVVTDMSPMLKWSLAIIAGGGVSATVQTAVGTVRGASTVVTAGLGNNIVTSFENITSTLLSILALISPLISIIIIILAIIIIFQLRKRKKDKIQDS